MTKSEQEFTEWFNTRTDEQKKKAIIMYGNYMMAFNYYKRDQELNDYECNSSCASMSSDNINF